MARKVRVTRKQVDAARAEVQAYRAAGLRPDPLVVRISNAATASAAPAEAADRTR